MLVYSLVVFVFTYILTQSELLEDLRIWLVTKLENLEAKKKISRLTCDKLAYLVQCFFCSSCWMSAIVFVAVELTENYPTPTLGFIPSWCSFIVGSYLIFLIIELLTFLAQESG